MAFADDKVFFADSPWRLQKQENSLLKYFKANKLEVNVEKTKTIFLQRGKFANKSKLPELKCGDKVCTDVPNKLECLTLQRKNFQLKEKEL